MRVTKPAYRVACMTAGKSIEPPEYIPPPLPVAAVEYWDCRKGFTYGVYPKIVSWAGQIRGTLVSQPNAARQPKLAYDPVLTAGAAWQYPVMYFSRASSETLATQTELSPSLIAAGGRPWHYSYFRYRSIAGTAVSINYLSDWPSGTNYGAGMFYIKSGTTLYADFWSNGEFAVMPAHTNPMRAEGYRRTADGALTARINGGAEVTKGSGYTAFKTAAVQFAGNYASYFADLSLAFSIVATAVPSAAEIAALEAWTIQSFGGASL